MMACNVYVVCGGVCDEKFGARYFQIGLMDSSVHGIQINHIERRNLFVLMDVRGYVRSPEVINKNLIKRYIKVVRRETFQKCNVDALYSGDCSCSLD